MKVKQPEHNHDTLMVKNFLLEPFIFQRVPVKAKSLNM